MTLNGPQAVAGVTYFQGMCDASAVVALNDQFQLVADDEDNILRLYDRGRGGAAVWSSDYSRFLQVDPAEPEVDIEAATRVGETVFWISSHGRNRKARYRTSRHRFFATTIVERQGLPVVEPRGVPYTALLADLLADPRFQEFGLATAAQLAPKASGALSIEGLASLPDGSLLLGFRNPQPFGKALVVPLENPEGIIAGETARFGEPQLLDLGDRGIRGLDRAGQSVIIAAGAHDNESRSALFEWRLDNHQLRQLPDDDLAGLNPESIEVIEDNGANTLLVVSDDGSVRIGKKPCKKLKDPRQKHFRSALLKL